MSYIFVKSSYSEKIDGTKIDGIELVFGETAFASLAEVAKKADAIKGKTVVVLDSKALSEGIELDNNIITAYDEIASDDKYSLTAKGSLTVDGGKLTGKIGGVIDGVETIGFQNVTVEKKAEVGDLRGGKISYAETEKRDWDKETLATTESTSNAAAGKLIVDDATIGAASGYATVELEAATTGALSDGGTFKYDYKYNETATTEVENHKLDYKASGKLTATDKTVIGGNVDGYATVSVVESTVNGSLTAGAQSWTRSSNVDDKKGTDVTKETSKDTATGKAAFVEATVNGSVENFATVELSKKSSVTGNITGGNGTFSSQNSIDDKKETESLKESNKFAAAGKVAVDESTVAGAITGYSDVKVTGKDASVGGAINAQSYEYSFDGSSDDKKDTGKISLKYAIKAAGKLAVEDATIGGAQGFANVTLDGATATGSIDAFGAVDFNSNAVDVEQVGNFTDYTVTGNADADKVVTKETGKVSSVGKLVAADSTLNGATGYANIDIKGGEAHGVFSKADFTVTTETTEDIEDTVVKTTATAKLGGSAKFVKVNGDATVSGYANVSVDASALGAISNNVESKFVSETLNDVEYASEYKAAANGSVTVKNDSEVGALTGFKTVAVTGKKGAVVNGDIASGVDDNVTDSKMKNTLKAVEGDDYTDYSGKYEESETEKADGSVTISKAEVKGNIFGYKDVTLTDATVAGAIAAGENETEKYSGSVKTVKKSEKDADGEVTVWGETTISVTGDEATSKGGKFTATNSTFGDVSGYSDIKLTDIEKIGAVTGVTEYKESYKATFVGNAENVDETVEYDQNKDYFNGNSTSKNRTYSDSEKSSGSFTFAVKDLDKGTDLVAAEIGNIADFNKVTISGVAAEFKRDPDTGKFEVSDAGLSVDVGSISDAGSSSSNNTEKEVINDGKAQGYSYSASGKGSYNATGSVTISNQVVVDGNIAGFKTVTISGTERKDDIVDTVVTGSVSAYAGAYTNASYSGTGSESISEKVTYDKKKEEQTIVGVSGKSSDTESGKAAGSFTLNNAYVAKDVLGFDKATVTDATVDGVINRGFDWSDKDSGTISTKGDLVTVAVKSDYTETAAGSIKVTDSTVGGIANYAKVEVIDSDVLGAIDIAYKVTESDSVTSVYDLEDFLANGDDAELEDFTWNGKYTETAIGDVKVSISAAKAKEMFEEDLDNTILVNGDIKGAKSVALAGKVYDADADEIAFVVVDGSVDGGNYEKTITADLKETTAVEKITAAGSFASEYTGITGSISGFDKVTLAETFVGGSVEGGNGVAEGDYDVENEVLADDATVKFTASGSLKAVSSYVVGNINGFAKVELDDVEVGGTIDGRSAVVEKDIEFSTNATLKMVDSEADQVLFFKSATVENSEIGTVAEVNKFTAAKGIVEVGTFIGGEEIDSELSINKGAVMTVGSFAADDEIFGDNDDKLTINGTLVVGDAAEYEDALDLATGSGVIAANKEIFDEIDGELDDFKGSYLNLGNTATGFRGTEYEKADDSLKTAVEIDVEDGYIGWLGGKADDAEVIGFTDTVDYIKFTIDDELIGKGLTIDADYEVVKFTGEGDADLTSLAAGEYFIKLERKEADSVSYSITLA